MAYREKSLKEKLWGTKEELQSTASFIKDTNIKVQDLGMRKMTAEEEEEEEEEEEIEEYCFYLMQHLSL